MKRSSIETAGIDCPVEACQTFDCKRPENNYANCAQKDGCEQ